MGYDSTLSAPFQVKPGKSETLLNQNTLLTQYRGGIGGKIGWTQASGATYIGMARRNGVTLIVTVLHCTALQEITAGEKLLNWGFAEDGQVRPVGTLVSPLPTAAALHKAAVARARAAARVKAAQLSSQAEARSGKTDAGPGHRRRHRRRDGHRPDHPGPRPPPRRPHRLPRPLRPAASAARPPVPPAPGLTPPASSSSAARPVRPPGLPRRRALSGSLCLDTWRQSEPLTPSRDSPGTPPDTLRRA